MNQNNQTSTQNLKNGGGRKFEGSWRAGQETPIFEFLGRCLIVLIDLGLFLISFD